MPTGLVIVLPDAVAWIHWLACPSISSSCCSMETLAGQLIHLIHLSLFRNMTTGLVVVLLMLTCGYDGWLAHPAFLSSLYAHWLIQALYRIILYTYVIIDVRTRYI